MNPTTRIIPYRKCNSCHAEDVVLVKYSNGEKTVECNRCGHFISSVDADSLKKIEEEIKAGHQKWTEAVRRENNVLQPRLKQPEFVQSASHKESERVGCLTW